MPDFSEIVTAHWNVPPTRGRVLVDTADFTLVIDPTLGQTRRAIHLVRPDGVDRFSVSPAAAEAMGISSRPPGSAVECAARLAEAGEQFRDQEYAFYLPDEARSEVATGPTPSDIRRLTEADAEAFALFERGNTPADIEEAYVELDHWLVVGAVEPDGDGGERITCVASVYPWQATRLADIGVLTAPSHRGRGLARAVVRAAAQETLSEGYEPQYRCQVTNLASRATGERAGFELFGTWRAVTGEVQEPSAAVAH